MVVTDLCKYIMFTFFFLSVCCVWILWLFFFFKQKTAYEMRISDWSSDVCSSDLYPKSKKYITPRYLMEQWDNTDYPKVLGSQTTIDKVISELLLDRKSVV